MAYDKLIYLRGDESREAEKIEMDIPSNLTIKEFKRLCVRLAYSLVYGEKGIKKTFGVGELNPDQDMEGFRKLLLDRISYGK